ncbi:MAG: VIT family protein [Actinomyces urogenitalis]|uniref:VIT1/CCC1 transporter family protein n=1 Tax=Actinomyces urogenitalis TaxID=103621 RepID=UPI00242AA0EF|nr:VIT family protein [Actinomyces urogenitalis]MCI7456872.1 VIT family protein [Actinomyces urogenitalis]MDY3678661.1 VIT family protein [Actinomyces urogenitalis]
MSSTRPHTEEVGQAPVVPALDARAPLSGALSLAELADDAAQAGTQTGVDEWAGTAGVPNAAPAPSSTDVAGLADVTDAADAEAARESRDAAVSLASRLNWLRAGVLGANDGIVSVAGLVIGVAAATPENAGAILTAGVAGVLAGAVSMAAGEYVSVSTQSDTERALVVRQREELAEDPEAGIDELASHYRAKGLSPATAMTVARELTAHDAVGAHLEAELGLREDEYTNPWHAAFSSAVAFTLGSLLPMLAIVLLPTAVKIPLTFVAVLVGLALTGGVSARLGEAPVRPAVIRNMAGGALAMVVTWGIGHLIGVSV